jgi:hypothetical protein
MTANSEFAKPIPMTRREIRGGELRTILGGSEHSVRIG